MKAREIRELTTEELRQRLGEAQSKLMSFRLQSVTGSVENVRASRNTRRDLARIKTVLREREIAAANADKAKEA